MCVDIVFVFTNMFRWICIFHERADVDTNKSNETCGICIFVYFYICKCAGYEMSVCVELMMYVFTYLYLIFVFLFKIYLGSFHICLCKYDCQRNVCADLMAFIFAFGGNVYYRVMGYRYGDPESTQFQLRCLHICLCMHLEM